MTALTRRRDNDPNAKAGSSFSAMSASATLASGPACRSMSSSGDGAAGFIPAATPESRRTGSARPSRKRVPVSTRRGSSSLRRRPRRTSRCGAGAAISTHGRSGCGRSVIRPAILTPPSLGRSIAWVADRRRDPTPINRQRAFLNASADRRATSPDRLVRPASPFFVQVGPLSGRLSSRNPV
jgi:hypothetical protein